MGNTRLIRGEDLFLFFFRDHHDFGRKIAKSEMKSKRRPFFLEVTMILGEKSERRDQSSFFSKEHQFLEILASGPEFEYPPLVATKIDKSQFDSE